MLDEAHRKREKYVIELALRNPRWGVHKIAREANVMFGGERDPLGHTRVESILRDADIIKRCGRWQRVEK